MQPRLGCHALEVGILERTRRRVGGNGVRPRAVPGDHPGHKSPVPFRVRTGTRPLNPLAKSRVFVVHTGVVDVDVNPQAVQPKVILAQHIRHRTVGSGLSLENLHTQTRPGEIVGQAARPIPLQALHLGEPGERRQLITWHARHQLGTERRTILREHLDAQLGQALGHGRFAAREQHHVEQRIVRQCLPGDGHLQ